MHHSIIGITSEIRDAADHLENCDPEALVNIARTIVRTLGRDGGEELTQQERGVLCDTVDHLLSAEAFGRSTWRLQAARTALRSIMRLHGDQ